MLGLLRKEDEDQVKSLTEPLPLAYVQRTFNEQEEDEEDIFMTPKTPSYVPQHDQGQYCPLSPPMISSVSDVPLPGDDKGDQQTADLTSGTPLRASVDDCASSEDSMRTHRSRKRPRNRARSQEANKRPRKTLWNYFIASQK